MLKGSAASGAAAGAANAAERCASANAPVSASVTQMVAATTLLFRERAGGCTCWIAGSACLLLGDLRDHRTGAALLELELERPVL